MAANAQHRGLDTRVRLVGLACVAAAAACANALSVASDAYGGFPLPAAGNYTVPVPELAFWAWYLTYGLAFLAFFTTGLDLLGLAARLATAARAAARWRGWPVLLPFFAGATSVAVRLWVLQRQVVADDEEVYLFAARTLLEGRVINPLPAEPEYFQNQFVILNSHGWFGKYPLGHSLVLALGLATRTLDFVVPALAGATAWLTWKFARAVVGPRRALWALALVVVSPHFTWTHATLLSQTTSCFGLVAACAAIAGRRSPTALRWAAGAALGLGLLARPAPAGLFVPVVMLHLFLADRRLPRLEALRRQLPLVVPMLLAGGALAAVNAAQAGSPLESGYHTFHGSLGWFGGSLPPQVGQSVFAALLRENFWLFGWPLSLAPVFFARPSRGRWLLWGPLLAQLAYRVAFPKTVVSTTGPIYVMETVPLLAILAADGLARLEVLLSRWWGKVAARQRLVASVFSAGLAALLLFTPVVAASVARGASARLAVTELLAQAGATRALVFANELVDPKRYLTWAYYPPNPSPHLSDPVVYLRWPRGKSEAQVKAFWKQHFPDRPAFYFQPTPEPRLTPLADSGP